MESRHRLFMESSVFPYTDRLVFSVQLMYNERNRCSMLTW